MNLQTFQDESYRTERLVYTPSAFARSSLVHLQEIGHLRTFRPHTSRRDHLDSFLFFVVEDGEGSLQYGTEHYEMRAGDCAFIDCRKAYAHITEEHPWALRWLHFDGPTIPAIFSKYQTRGGQFVFHPAQTGSFISCWDRVRSAAESSDFIRDMRINAALNDLLVLLMEESWNPDKETKAASSTSKEGQVWDYLSTHFAEKLSLDHLSERFHVNKFYLTRLFKARYGCTINQRLLELRTTYAKELLRFSDKPLEVIGRECGLGGLAYFSRMFKQAENLSPLEYRKVWKTKQQ